MVPFNRHLAGRCRVSVFWPIVGRPACKAAVALSSEQRACNFRVALHPVVLVMHGVSQLVTITKILQGLDRNQDLLLCVLARGFNIC